jgi:hypothetical protein
MTRNESDHNLYILIKNGRCVIIILYVDDLMLTVIIPQNYYSWKNLKNGLKCLNLE